MKNSHRWQKLCHRWWWWWWIRLLSQADRANTLQYFPRALYRCGRCHGFVFRFTSCVSSPSSSSCDAKKPSIMRTMLQESLDPSPVVPSLCRLSRLLALTSVSFGLRVEKYWTDSVSASLIQVTTQPTNKQTSDPRLVQKIIRILVSWVHPIYCALFERVDPVRDLSYFG